MKQIDVDQLKTIQLDILKCVNQYCRNNNIEYWLDYGTLIGAIRHNGFIPWDDDIDIGMLRKDFDSFYSNFNTFNERYKVVCYLNDHAFPWTFAKIIDTRTKLVEADMNQHFSFYVYIDLFIYDNAPDDDKDYQKQFKKLRMLQILNAHQADAIRLHGSPIRKLALQCIKFFLPFFPNGYFAMKFDNLRKKYNSQDTRRVVCCSLKRKPIDKNALNKTIPCRFEDSLFPIPIGYDKHLTNAYNTPYMELPPEDQRINTHFFKAYIE